MADTQDGAFEHLETVVEEEYILIKGWKLPVPWPVSDIQPELHFYTRKDPGHPYIATYTLDPLACIKELEDAGMLPRNIQKLLFITHGFENDICTPWLPDMKDAVLEVEGDSALVCLVGWGRGANINPIHYAQGAANTQTVAKWLEKYVKAFRERAGDGLHIWGIGHSLGAHLLGLTGRFSEAFDRISGLDPAGPSFEKVNQENRLCKGDARVVDVIHTDGYDTKFDPQDWFAPVNHYGTLIPLGTTDFYPNFGFRQPGISHFRIAESHHRSIDLFIWSIRNPGSFVTNAVLSGMPGFEDPVEQILYVQERAEMGYHFLQKKANKGDNAEPVEGLFYLQTNGCEPWVDPEGQGQGRGHEEKGQGDGEEKDCGGYWPKWGGCVVS